MLRLPHDTHRPPPSEIINGLRNPSLDKYLPPRVSLCHCYKEACTQVSSTKGYPRKSRMLFFRVGQNRISII